MKPIPMSKTKQRVAVQPESISHRAKALRNNSVISRISSKSRWFALIYRIFVYVILIDLAFVFLYPFIYMITTSLKHPVDLIDFAIKWIPTSLAWENFYYGMKGLQFWTHFNNSALISVVSVIGQVLSCSFVAYGFSRIRFPGREVLFVLCMFTMIIPPQTIIVPLYMQYKTIGWLDSVMPLIVPSFLRMGLGAPCSSLSSASCSAGFRGSWRMRRGWMAAEASAYTGELFSRLHRLRSS